MQVKALFAGIFLTLVPSLPSQAAGLPGMRGIDHVGITVANLHEAVLFFVNVLGCKPSYLRPGGKADDNWYQENLNVNPRAEISGFETLRCGHGSNVEVFEYKSPDQAKSPPKNSDIGGHHLSFYVDDMDKAVAYLRTQKSVRVLGKPKVAKDGPYAGNGWIYFIAPWGLQMELVSFPNGRPGGDKLWDTRDPAK